MRKPDKPTRKAASRISTSVPSLAVREMGHSMTYWLAKISPGDIGRLWSEMRDYAVGATRPIWWLRRANGTTSKLGCRGGVTVYTTDDGFAFLFTEKDTSKSAGGKHAGNGQDS